MLEKPADQGQGNGTTWFTPYFLAFKEIYGEKPSDASVKMMVRPLRALEREHGAEETLRRYRNYLHSTPKRFYKTAGFAERFVAFKDALPSKVPGMVPDPEPGESTDAYILRLARLGFA
jgi:hypothetical protein